jgi:hypothetical protein
MNLTGEMELGLEQTTEAGVYCASALKPHQTGKTRGRKTKTPNRTLGNPAVRDYRGASRNVAMVEL